MTFYMERFCHRLQQCYHFLLQKVQMFLKMKASSTIKLDKKCWGVAVYGEEIYVELNKDLKEGEVRVLDLKGQLERCLGINPSGPVYKPFRYHRKRF